MSVSEMSTDFSPKFGPQLREWRTRAGLTQIQLDERIEKKPGFVRHLESSLTKPPSLPTCRRIADVLGVPPHVVWDTARPERLRGFDEDLYRHYELGEREAGVCADESGPWKNEEVELVETLRWLDEDVPGADTVPLAEHLLDLVLGLLVDRNAGRRAASALANKVVMRVRRFQDLPASKQAAVLKVLVAAMDVAIDDESASPVHGTRRAR